MEYIDFPTTPPSEENKVWTITKTSTALLVDCNGVEVLNLVYSDYSEECATAWSNEVDRIMFYPSADTASDEYHLELTSSGFVSQLCYFLLI